MSSHLNMTTPLFKQKRHIALALIISNLLNFQDDYYLMLEDLGEESMKSTKKALLIMLVGAYETKTGINDTIWDKCIEDMKAFAQQFY